MSGKLGVIGHPIKHSLSPVMHQHWFRKYGIDAVYDLIDIPSDDLATRIERFRESEWVGFNVTIPHKVAMLSLIDEVKDVARSIGAVNTIINKNGKLIGTNTDGEGLILCLQQAGFSLHEEVKVLIIGAGGAARAVGLSIARGNVSCVDFTNRTVVKAEQLSQSASTFTQSQSLSLTEAEQALDKYNLIINATSAGMEPLSMNQPLSLKHVSKDAFCVDLIYKPLKTLWLAEAEERGCRTMNGLPMLIYQGALAFKYWFDILPDVTGMEALLIKNLNQSM